MMRIERVGNEFSGWGKALFWIFLFTLPLANPWVRGDGVGYYAYARSMLVEHKLDFEKDWKAGNETFVSGRVGQDGQVLAKNYTSTGHIANLWSVGPSILWAPFLVVTHLGVLLCNRLGGHIPANGFSRPYLITMAGATALYGFLGVWFSFCLAREYFEERWAFLAAVGIWWASSLPVYMYFNPSWSHAHSAFIVALFVYYWHRTRRERSWRQWILLGLLSGLMVDVYYPNGLLLLIPLLEAITLYWHAWKARGDGREAIPRLFLKHVIYVSFFIVALLPTLISRRIIFGSALSTGYGPPSGWRWSSPAYLKVLFSSDHGLLSWTPILAVALVGLVMFRRVDRAFGTYLILTFVAFWWLISLHPDWDGMSSFGNRFFISLTPLFVLGLAAFMVWLERVSVARRAVIAISSVTAVLILWNVGLIYQWGTHLVPARGEISWPETVRNQFAVVPVRMEQSVETYFLHRRDMMQHIEQEDIEQQKAEGSRED